MNDLRKLYANAASDPTYIARHQELAWKDHLARAESMRQWAIRKITKQPFYKR